MSNLIKINSKDLQIKEFKNQRVVTFKDIDMVHERAEGTASRNFRENRDKFIKDVDYFHLSYEEVRATNFVERPNSQGLTLMTESGYLMLVKSLTDDLAWKVQRQLVNNYFRGKQLSNNLDNLSPQLQLLINMELKQKELEAAVTETKEEIASVKENIIVDYNDWRKWANDRVKAIGATLGDYRRAYNESYDELEERAKCNLKRRLQNKVDRLKKSGAGKKKINNTNYLDIIGEDKRLQEIYTSIVKEMCVKYL